MSRPPRTFQDDEVIPGRPHRFGVPSVLPLLYDQEGEDEAVDEIGRGGHLHSDDAQE